MKKIVFLVIQLYLFGIILSCSKEIIDESGFGIVKGRALKELTFEPLANAKISSSPSSSSVITDADGNFILQNIPAGNYSFQAQKDGYIAKYVAGSVAIGGTIELLFEMKIQQSTNNSPTIPVLVLPVDTAEDQPLSENLTWTCTDPDKDILKYDVILRNVNNDIIQTFSDILVPNFTLLNLNYATKYYWQIAVSDGTNPKVYSEVRSFKTAIFPNARFLFVRKINGNNTIFNANETGNELQISPINTNSYRPRKNIQANKIAFIKSDGAQEHIYTMSFDGSNVAKITNSVPIAGFNLDYINFCWSSNGSQIIYPNFDKLYKINADGSGLTLLYQTTNGKFISECDWSIDNSLIAIKTNNINGYNAEILVLNSSGTALNTILTGVNGAVGGLQFSTNNQKLIFTRDISGYQAPDYRQLDTTIFIYNFILNTTTTIPVSKPIGTNDLDVRFSPNESELIFENTSNDGLSTKYIQKSTSTGSGTRTTLFTNATMPDWK